MEEERPDSRPSEATFAGSASASLAKFAGLQQGGKKLQISSEKRDSEKRGSASEGLSALIGNPRNRKTRTTVFAAPEEEDNGALCRQLMLGLQDVLSRYTKAPKTIAEALGTPPPEEKKTVEEALLACIKKIQSLNSKANMQYKLQNFVLEFLHLPPHKHQAPIIDIEARIQERNKFWAPLHTNCSKWSHGGDRMQSTIQRDKTFMTAVNIEKKAITTGSSWGNSTMRSGDSSLAGFDVGDRNSRFDQTLGSKGYSTLRSFSALDGKEKLSPLPTDGEGSGHKDPKTKRIIRAPWGAVNGDIGHCHICQRKARCFIPGDEFKANKRRRQTFFFPPCIHQQKNTQDSRVESKSSSQSMRKTSSLPAIPQLGTTTGWLHSIHPNLNGTDKNTLTRFRSPQNSYFSACEKQLVLPRVPSFLLRDKVGDNGSNVHLPDQELLDRDLLALVAPIKCSGVKSLGLSRNYFTDEGIRSFLEEIHSQVNESLGSLDVSFTGASDACVGSIAELLQAGCARLHHINLGGVVLSDNTWNAFCDALVEHSNLRSLKLPECQLGRMSQNSPIRVAGLLATLPFLECLDLSGNFFFRGGCEALAKNLEQSLALTDLNMSHNASSHLIPSKRMRVKTPPGNSNNDDEVEFEEVANFNPILLFLEGLRSNTSLVKLHLSGSNVEYSADFVLYASLEYHPSIEYLDISDNPHGEDGLRVLLRLLMPSRCRIVYCDVSECRDSKLDSALVKYNFAEPRGRYNLDLAHPQHRSVLRLMLTCPERGAATQKSGRKSMSQVGGGTVSVESCFKNVQVSSSINGKWYWKDDFGWGLPRNGEVSFDFIWSQEFEKNEDPGETVRLYYRSRRVALTMGRFVTLYGMYEKLRDDLQKSMMIRAMHDQVLLKMCHLRKIMQLSPTLLELVVNMLYSSVEGMDSMALFDLIPRKDASRRFRKVARSHFFFNPSNPTDHYELDLDVPTQFSVAEKVAILNAFEMIAAGTVDTSQYGKGEGVRNCTWNANTVKSFVGFTVPPYGRLSLDYVSPKPPHARIPAMSATGFDALMQQLQTSECSKEDQVQALRTVSHQMVLDMEQLNVLLKDMNNHNIVVAQNPLARRSALDKMIRAQAKVRAMSMFGITLQKSAFQFEDFNPRVEAFICFFNRCKEQIEICTQNCLYNDKMFSKQCGIEVKKRLGVLRVFDAIHVADEASNCGNRFVCRLWIFEEWQIARFLVLLAIVEDGANMMKTKWSERNFMAEQGYDFLVPSDWVQNIPMVGTFSVTYVEEKEEYRNVGERRRLAEMICGWPTIKR